MAAPASTLKDLHRPARLPRAMPTRTPAEDFGRYEFQVFAADVADAVRSIGGLIFDRAMAGWDVSVVVDSHSGRDIDDRPIRILGARVSNGPARPQRAATLLAVAADVIIQATSAGMLGGPPGEEVAGIVPWDSLSPRARAYDVIYNPPVTPFLRLARMRGLRAMDGLGMLVGQAARSFTLWTGLEAPVEIMRAAAEESLEKAASVR